MTALAELATTDLFGRLVSGNCPRCGGGDGCACTHCQTCHRPHGQCTCPKGDVLSPLPDDVVTEPWSLARVTAVTVSWVGVGLLTYVCSVAFYLAEWRGAA